MTKLEQFAKDVMGIKMTEYQVKIATAMVQNRLLTAPRSWERTTTRNIVLAYMADSVKEVI